MEIIGLLYSLIMKKKTSCLLLLFLTHSIASAELTWESKSLEFNPTASDTQVEAHFKFQNNGAVPVTIKKVTTSCGCTTATLSKDRYEAGEKGEIVAAFKFGNRIGVQQKKVLLETNAPDNAKVDLTLKVTIPERVHIEPTLISWKKNEPLEEKPIRIEALNGFKIKKVRIIAPDPNLVAEVKTVMAGKRYDIPLLIRRRGVQPVTAGLKIGIEDEASNEMVYLVTARAE